MVASNTASRFPSIDWGVMSPNPTVVRVTKLKYSKSAVSDTPENEPGEIPSRII